MILGQPGLFFGGIDPTAPKNKDSGEQEDVLTEEYQCCLIARIRQVTSEKYFVPDTIRANFDRSKTPKELEVTLHENSIDLTS